MITNESIPLDTQLSLLSALRSVDNAAFIQIMDVIVQQFQIDSIMNIQESAYKNYNILGWALIEQNEQIVDYLLKLGANINAIDQEGTTILHKLAIQNKTNALLLAYLKGADFTIPDSRGFNVINHIREQLFRYKWFAPSRITPLQTILRKFETRLKLEVLFLLPYTIWKRLGNNLHRHIVSQYL